MMPVLTPLHDNSPPSRPNSIFGQRFMITSSPAASAVAAASSLRIPSCIQTHFRADRDGVGDDAGRVLGGTEHVHHVDLVGNVAQRRVDPLAEQRLAGDARVDRDHPIAFALEILHHEVARPVPVRRGADQAIVLTRSRIDADLGVGIRDRFEIGHGPRSIGKAPILAQMRREAHASAGPGFFRDSALRPLSYPRYHIRTRPGSTTEKQPAQSSRALIKAASRSPTS